MNSGFAPSSSRCGWLVCFGLLTWCSLACADTPAAGNALDKAACAKLMSSQRMAPRQSVFDTESFPEIDYPNKDLIEAALGPYALKIRYFDAAYHEMEKPAAPGRYGARVEVNFPNGYTELQHVTLYRTPGPYRSYRDKYDISVRLPAVWGISSDTQSREDWNMRDLFFALVGHGTHHSDGPAILAAGLMEIQADPAHLHGDSWRFLNTRWWNGLEAKLNGPPPDYQRVVHLPDGYDKDSTKRWPVLMFLHGLRGGNDFERLREAGPLGYIKAGHDLPFIVVVPQTLAMDGWEPERLATVLDQIEAQYRVDRKRIYVTGMSMGGFGTFDLAFLCPQRIAAIAPIAGGVNPAVAERLKTMPTWIFQGTDDSVVPPSYSTDIADRMKAIGASEVKLTLWPGGGHDKLGVPYYGPELYDWFLQHALP